MEEVRSEPSAQMPAPICAICQCPTGPGESLVRCGSCNTIYHADCWDENGGCGVHGCPQVPPTEPLTSVEIPTSYWGQERKRCPACGADILAAAVRCKQCGSTFESARPEHPVEYHTRQDTERRLPAIRKHVVWLFICSVIPCLAPFAAVLGPIWYARHHAHVRALPAVYPALARVALAVAIGQTAFGILVAMLRSLAGSR
jgi:hypothetical protein